MIFLKWDKLEMHWFGIKSFLYYWVMINLIKQFKFVSERTWFLCNNTGWKNNTVQTLGAHKLLDYWKIFIFTTNEHICPLLSPWFLKIVTDLYQCSLPRIMAPDSTFHSGKIEGENGSCITLLSQLGLRLFQDKTRFVEVAPYHTQCCSVYNVASRRKRPFI